MSPDRTQHSGTPAADRRSAVSRPSLLRRTGRAILVLAFWLLVWQLAAMWVAREVIAEAWRAGDTEALLRAVLNGRELLLPGPALSLRPLAELALPAEFWSTTGASLLRSCCGFAAGAVLGTALAVLTAALPWADTLLSPAIRVVRAAPVASFIILVLLWVQTGLVPGVISGLMVLPVVWGNVHQGFRSTDPLLLEMARAYRFGRGKTLRLVYLPSVLPHFASGCTTALGLAWKSGVAAEVLCLPRQAIGSQVYYSKLSLETPSLFAWTAVVILLSLALERLLKLLLERGRGAQAWR